MLPMPTTGPWGRSAICRHTFENLHAIVSPRTIQGVSGSPPAALTAEERRACWGTRMYGRGYVPSEVHAKILRRLQIEHTVDPAVWARSRTERFVAWDPIRPAPNALTGTAAGNRRGERGCLGF